MISLPNRYIARTFTVSGSDKDKEYYIFDTELKWIKRDEEQYFGSNIIDLFRRCDELNREEKLYNQAIEEFLCQ